MKASEPRQADPYEVMKRSRRFDLIFKLSLARAMLSGDAGAIREAETAYLESVRARNGFYEDVPPRNCPADFLAAFRRTFQSIRDRGYDPALGAIPVDAAGEVLNGAHRLVSCIACSVPCWVVESDCHLAGGSVMRTFVKGHIHPAVLNWGVRKYFELVPDGCLKEEFGSPGDYPELPFPDWRARNRGAWRFKVKPALSWTWYSLTLPFKRGEAREKQLRRILRERRKISGFAALADYWRDRKDGE
ncbi:MAG: hypothetical protein IJI73_01230 [Kiritimatiellae bacterium]|nr:hypothetical protein [Kiritimatiellia bacterium]